MLLRTDLFRCDSLEELFIIQDRIDKRLFYWEDKHDEFSHNTELTFGKSNFTLKIEIYEEQQYPNYN